MINEIQLANQYDMIFIAAAGNSGVNNDVSPVFPAQYGSTPYDLPNVIAVANTNNVDGLDTASDYGLQSVHLGAPGTHIYSLLRTAETFTQTPGYFIGGPLVPSDVNQGTGTSASAPFVSGAAALILSACSLDTAGLKAVLLNNVDVIPSLAAKTITGGRLNVNRSIHACVPRHLVLRPTWFGTVTINPGNTSYVSACDLYNLTYTGEPTLTFVATPASNSIFSGWSGACTGTGPCSFKMDGDYTLQANFVCAPGQNCRPPRCGRLIGDEEDWPVQ